MRKKGRNTHPRKKLCLRFLKVLEELCYMPYSLCIVPEVELGITIYYVYSSLSWHIVGTASEYKNIAIAGVVTLQ